MLGASLQWGVLAAGAPIALAIVIPSLDPRDLVAGLGIGYGDSIEEARNVIIAALRGIDGVEKKPDVQVRVQDLGASSVVLRVVWHTNSLRTDVVRTRAAVLEAVKNALDAAQIDMPCQTQVPMLENRGEGEGPRVAENGRRKGSPQGAAGTGEGRRNAA